MNYIIVYVSNVNINRKTSLGGKKTLKRREKDLFLRLFSFFVFDDGVIEENKGKILEEKDECI